MDELSLDELKFLKYVEVAGGAEKKVPHSVLEEVIPDGECLGVDVSGLHKKVYINMDITYTSKDGLRLLEQGVVALRGYETEHGLSQDPSTWTA